MLLKSLFPTLRNNNNTFDLSDLTDLQRRMDSMFDDLLSPVSTQARSLATLAPDYDVTETDDHYLLRIDMPGVAREDLKVEVRDNVLYVSGERKNEWKEDKKTQGKGRYYGRFESALALPAGTNADAVEANYEHGVLRIAVPKSEDSKPKQIKISDGSKGSSFWSKLIPNRADEQKKNIEPKQVEVQKAHA